VLLGLRKVLAAFLAVLSAFIGIRRKNDAVNDQSLHPAAIVVVALICVALIVASLIGIVRVVVGK
jgi:membrane-associated phospholipid phosphatase